MDVMSAEERYRVRTLFPVAYIMTLENLRGSGRKQRCLPASCKVIVPVVPERAITNGWAQTSSGLCCA